MPKPTFPSVSVVWKQKTTETDGNVGFGMGQEKENDRD
jgi:hypothetical protein